MGERKTVRPETPGHTSDTKKPPRAYRPPRLVEYGSVTKLTLGTLSRSSDGAMGGFSMMRMP